MKKLDLRLIDADLVEVGGTAGQVPVRQTDGSYEWEDVLPTEGVESPRVLTVLSGGSFAWVGNVVVVIPAGGSIPSGTPAGAVIVELDE